MRGHLTPILRTPTATTSTATTSGGPSRPTHRAVSAAPARCRTVTAHPAPAPNDTGYDTGYDTGDDTGDDTSDDTSYDTSYDTSDDEGVGKGHDEGADTAHRTDDTLDGIHDDAGAVAVELTLLAPLFVLLLLFVVAVGRVTSARITVADLARHAARTLTVDPAGPSTDRARQAVLDEENRNGLTCGSLTVTTDPPTALASGFTDPTASPATTPPGGGVTVRVSCTVTLGDLTGLALPSTVVLTATATSPLDRYRSIP